MTTRSSWPAPPKPRSLRLSLGVLRAPWFVATLICNSNGRLLVFAYGMRAAWACRSVRLARTGCWSATASNFGTRPTIWKLRPGWCAIPNTRRRRNLRSRTSCSRVTPRRWSTLFWKSDCADRVAAGPELPRTPGQARPALPQLGGKTAGPGPRTGAPSRPVAWGGRNSQRPAPAGERLYGRDETGWLARTQGGREPQRGSMPVRSTDEDSRPTEDNARSGLKNGERAFPDRLAWGLDTRKSPTAQDRSACLRLFETTSRRPVSPRPAPRSPQLQPWPASQRLQGFSGRLARPRAAFSARRWRRGVLRLRNCWLGVLSGSASTRGAGHGSSPPPSQPVQAAATQLRSSRPRGLRARRGRWAWNRERLAHPRIPHSCHCRTRRFPPGCRARCRGLGCPRSKGRCSC